MLKIRGNEVSLTRGDTARISINFKNDDGTPYELEDGDSVVMTIKKTFYDKEPLFSVGLSKGIFVIPSSATRELEYGRYVYDIQITKSDGTIITPIVDNFIITQEVTF